MSKHQAWTLSVAQTPAMRRLMEKVHTVAPFDCTVLLLGETGTGKSHFGDRSTPCLHGRAALFGDPVRGPVRDIDRERVVRPCPGAFTGAASRHTGRLAAAGTGTVLLDDIDAVPLETQPKLLRVVEDRMFQPLGTHACPSRFKHG